MPRQVCPLPARGRGFSIAGSRAHSRPASARSIAPPTARLEFPTACRRKFRPRNPRWPSRPAECRKPAGWLPQAACVSPERAPARSAHSEAAWSARRDRRKVEAEWPWAPANSEKPPKARYICACTCTSVGVEIGSCITSRRACSSVLGVLCSRWTAWRNPGSVTRPSTTIAARITIVVLSPFDKALLASRFINRSKRGHRARYSVGQARAHLIERGSVRHADARYFDGHRGRAHGSQLPHRRFERSLR